MPSGLIPGPAGCQPASDRRKKTAGMMPAVAWGFTLLSGSGARQHGFATPVAPHQARVALVECLGEVRKQGFAGGQDAGNTLQGEKSNGHTESSDAKNSHA